ncbi:hypothetical protein DPMN_126741 [Dreissena polymorpha]|uniref:3'-5' exonuclease domain-containing protein n=1 Tax=Dreissena polymorpha TaxID=45954 RepID=A0A9D4JUS2_DREPO|nr:hypothetical protein DPMN_126741 [Dreissena polymorpha]
MYLCDRPLLSCLYASVPYQAIVVCIFVTGHDCHACIPVLLTRPLPEELQKYAREDTHYLLYIYDRLRNELIERGNNSNNMLLSVMHRSKQVCAKVGAGRRWDGIVLDIQTAFGIISSI